MFSLYYNLIVYLIFPNSVFGVGVLSDCTIPDHCPGFNPPSSFILLIVARLYFCCGSIFFFFFFFFFFLFLVDFLCCLCAVSTL